LVGTGFQKIGLIPGRNGLKFFGEGISIIQAFKQGKLRRFIWFTRDKILFKFPPLGF